MGLFGQSDQISEKVEGVIGAGFTVKGTVTGQGSLRVDGFVEGNLEITGSVIVGEQAHITGNIKAHNVLVAGDVTGDVNAEGRLEVTAKGHIAGDITTATLVIDEGGILNGQSKVTREA